MAPLALKLSKMGGACCPGAQAYRLAAVAATQVVQAKQSGSRIRHGRPVTLAQINLGDALVRHDLVNRPLRENPSEMQHRHAAGDLAHEGHVMLHRQHRQAVRLQGAHYLAGRLGLLRRHAGCRFVEHKQLRLEAGRHT